MPTPPPTTPPLESESAEALASMESDAAAYFAERDEARAAEALNPVAPVLERAAAAPAKAPPAKAPATKPLPSPGKSAAHPGAPGPSASTPPEARVPGAPRLTPPGPPDAKTDEAARASTASPPPAADDPDIPREYKPGGVRAVNWNKLHAKADHYEALCTQRAQEISDLQAALEGAKATAPAASPETQARLAALQTERDTYLSQLRAVAGERLFDSDSRPRRDAATLQAKAAVGPEQADRIDAIFALPEGAYRDEQIEALYSSLPPVRANRLMTAVGELDRLSLERSAAAAKGGDLLASRVAEYTASQERATQERNARAAATFDAELKEWEVAGVTPAEVELARSVYTGKNATLQDASRAAFWGAVGPRVASVLQDSQARVAELEGELGRLRSAQPGVGAAASGALPAASADDDDESSTSYAERIARQAARAGVRFGS